MDRYKCMVHKVTAEGETLAFEVRSDKLDTILSSVGDITRTAEGRMIEMNKRILEKHGLMQYLSHEERNRFEMLLSYLCGEVSLEVVRNRLAIMQEERDLAHADVE